MVEKITNENFVELHTEQKCRLVVLLWPYSYSFKYGRAKYYNTGTRSVLLALEVPN